MSGAARILTFSLEVGSFFLQFLDWWYAQGGVGGAHTVQGGSQDIPKPPPAITGKHDKYRASIKRQTFQVETCQLIDLFTKDLIPSYPSPKSILRPFWSHFWYKDLVSVASFPALWQEKVPSFQDLWQDK